MNSILIKLKICYSILSGRFTYSNKFNCAWLWTKEPIVICFGKDNFRMFDHTNQSYEEKNNDLLA